MASVELAQVGSGEDNDLGLNARQVAALQALEEMGAGPAPLDENDEPIWDKDPKTRAYQLIFAGKWGGPNRGQGRKRTNRAAEELTEEIRSGKFVKRMKQALRRALKESEGARVNLQAIQLAMEIENKERKLQLDEEEQNQIGDTREELLGALFELVQKPATAAALDGTYEEITEAEVVEDNEDDIDRGGTEAEGKQYAFQQQRSREKRKLKLKTKPPRTNRRKRDSSGAVANGRNGSSSSGNGSNGAAEDRQARSRADEEA